MTLSLTKKLALAGLVGLMGVMATTSDADAYGGRRRGGHGYGPGIGLGILGGLVVGAAIASQPRYAPAPQYAPQYGFGNGYDNGYGYQQQPAYYADQYHQRPQHRYRCLITRYDAYGYAYQAKAWCRN